MYGRRPRRNPYQDALMRMPYRKPTVDMSRLPGPGEAMCGVCHAIVPRGPACPKCGTVFEPYKPRPMMTDAHAADRSDD